MQDLHGVASQKTNFSGLRSLVSKNISDMDDPFDDQVPNPKRSDADEADLLRSMEDIFATRGKRVALDVGSDPSVSRLGWSRRDIALACLRMRKYDAFRAVLIFETFCEWRRDLNAHHGGVDPVANEGLNEQLNSGMLRFLRCVDKLDRPLIHIRLRFHNPKKYSAYRVMQLFALMQEALLRDPDFGERAQCNGVCFIQDGEDVSFRNLDIRIPRELMSTIQSKTPFRVGGVMGMNLPFFARILFRFARPFLSDKVKRRIFMMGSPADLSSYVTEENLLVQWGGSYQYDHSGWVQSVRSLKAA